MTDRVSVAQTIAAPAEVLYDLVSDVTRMGDWSPETVRCRWMGDATGPKVGARFAGVNSGKGRRWMTGCTVTAAEPGRRFAFHVSVGPLDISDWTYEFTPATDGTTEVTETWDDRRPRWMRIASGPVMGVRDRAVHNEAGMRTTLERLRTAAETATASR